MISSTMQAAINDQINKELHSSYIYQSMKNWFDKNNWPGFTKWMAAQVKEEQSHAAKFESHINDRMGKVVLDPIEAPPGDFQSHLDVFEKGLEHEKFITKSLYELMGVAVREGDYMAQVLLHWYIAEQVEEENNFDTICTQLRAVNGDGAGLLLMDERLGARA